MRTIYSLMLLAFFLLFTPGIHTNQVNHDNDADDDDGTLLIEDHRLYGGGASSSSSSSSNKTNGQVTSTPVTSELIPDHHDESLLLGSDSLPIFLMEPQDSYVVKNKPVTLQCRAAHALNLYFKCNGAGVKNMETANSEFVDPQTGVRIIEGDVNVTRDMVEEFFSDEKFKCECYAWNGRDTIQSQPATVDVAYLKKQFEVNPQSTRVEVSHQTELRCVPPAGMPPPRIYWLQGGQPLHTDTTVLVTSEGHLLLGQARAQDTNNYTCVAENIAAKRTAPPAQVTVYVNGGWSQWSQWTDCRCPSNSGQQPSISSGKMSTRTCTNPQPTNGGRNCQGSSVRRTKDCLPCPQDVIMDPSYDYDFYESAYYDGPPPRWSAWSDWSVCNVDCLKTRRRQCIPGGAGRKICPGRDIQTAPCTSAQCQSMELIKVREANFESTNNDIALYIGITAGIFFVCLPSIFLLKVYWKKNAQHHHRSLYNMAASDYHPEFYPEHDKKSLNHLQPDLTQTVPPCYEYPSYGTPQHQSQSSAANNHLHQQQPLAASAVLIRSVSEHHYDVPHLATNSSPSDVVLQMSPTTSSTLESSSGKRSQLSSSGSSSHNNTNNNNSSDNSTYEVATESVKLSLHNNHHHNHHLESHSIVTHHGGVLQVADSGVCLLVPEGALRRHQSRTIHVAIVQEDSARPLFDSVTQLSPIVSCRGAANPMAKSVVLRMPHCAEITSSNWTVTVLQMADNDTATTSSEASSSSSLSTRRQWRSAVILGQETINTGVFCQLDGDVAYLVTDQMCRYVIVGASTKGHARKRLKLAVFAPKSITTTTIDYNLRVYVVEDYGAGAMEAVYHQERRLGGILLQPPKPLLFEDGGGNLSLRLEAISAGGWQAKSGCTRQEIPFRHVWQASSNTLHCAFTLESHECTNQLAFKICAAQMGVAEEHSNTVSCQFDVIVYSADAIINEPLNVGTEETTPMLLQLGKAGRPHQPCGGRASRKTTTPTIVTSDRGVSTCDDFQLRLVRHTRKQLCQLLDTPTVRANDWRMLAHALHVDRYINFFATKPSPTDAILDLWEARNRQSNALGELRRIFHEMERYDAVSVLDTSLGPNWI